MNEIKNMAPKIIKALIFITFFAFCTSCFIIWIEFKKLITIFSGVIFQIARSAFEVVNVVGVAFGFFKLIYAYQN